MSSIYISDNTFLCKFSSAQIICQLIFILVRLRVENSNSLSIHFHFLRPVSSQGLEFKAKLTSNFNEIQEKNTRRYG